MKRLIPISLICVLFLGVGITQAQTAKQPLGFKIKFGFNAYDGDLGNEILQYNDNDFLYGVGLAAYLNRFFDLALDAQYFTLDKVNGPNDSVTRKRNTSFASDDFNVNLMLRFKPFDTRLNPYIAGGAGINFLKDEDDVQRDDSHTVFSIPFGVGINYALSDHFSFNAQAIYHKTFVDDIIDNYPLSSSKAADGNSRPEIDGNDSDNFFTTSIGIVFDFGGGETKKENLNRQMLKQSMKNLQAAQNANQEASNTLRQAQQLNDETLTALDSLKKARSMNNEQANELKAELVHIINNVQFEFDKSDIIDPAKNELRSLADIMNNYPGLQVDVSGHADERGSKSYNKNLSQRRAQSVKDYLMNQGIDRSRITTNAYGETNPLMQGNSATAYGQNRSVRLTLSYNGNGMMHDNDSMQGDAGNGQMNNEDNMNGHQMVYMAKLQGRNSSAGVSGDVKVMSEQDSRMIHIKGDFSGLGSDFKSAILRSGNSKTIQNLHPDLNTDNQSGSFDESHRISQEDMKDLQNGKLFLVISTKKQPDIEAAWAKLTASNSNMN